MINAQALFFTVVNKGDANDVLTKAQEYGAAGGMIFIGEGTVRSKVLEKAGLMETQKEILMISASREVCSLMHKKLSTDFEFHRRNKGIAFTIPFMRFGSHLKSVKHVSDSPYSCIMAVVDRGHAIECLKAARVAGARGGTILHGTGAGIPVDFYYPITIEPQKDILIIITSKDKTHTIRKSIIKKLDTGKSQSKYVFTLPVTESSGLYENRYRGRQRK